MKILALQAQNVKRLHAVEIRPDGSMIVIGGGNEAGKSSVLDSIMYALGGGAMCPEEPIRYGERKATVRLALGERAVELVVTRTFSQKGTSLKLETADGDPIGSPQTLLDTLYSAVAFDPLAFERMKPKARIKALRAATGLDFTTEDQYRQELFEERRAVHRRAKELGGVLAQSTWHTDAPQELMSVTDLVAEREAARGVICENATQRAALESTTAEMDRLQAERTRMLNELEELKGAVWANERAYAVLTERAEQLTERIAGRVDPDLTVLDEQIANSEQINAKVRENAARAKVLADKAEEEKRIQGLTMAIAEIDDAKSTAIAEAALPVEGLTFDEDGVRIDGVPFEQCSQAQRLRTSVAVGLAMNPKLPVLLIRDGSLLDATNLRLVAEMAEAANAQVWIERVGDGDECSIVIEDGTVRTDMV